jgi:hypothetical protein
MTRRRLIAAAVGAASFALWALALGQSPLALLRLSLLGAALGAVVESDLSERRIPNRIVVPAALVCAALSAAAGIALLALVEGLVLVGALLALSLVRAQALGMGDVKLTRSCSWSGSTAAARSRCSLRLCSPPASASCCSSASDAPPSLASCRLRPSSPPGR